MTFSGLAFDFKPTGGMHKTVDFWAEALDTLSRCKYHCGFWSLAAQPSAIPADQRNREQGERRDHDRHSSIIAGCGPQGELEKRNPLLSPRSHRSLFGDPEQVGQGKGGPGLRESSHHGLDK